MNNYSVYMHVFPNNKIYIGITSNKVNRRWNNGLGYRKNILMFRAINKYGWNNIAHKILHENLSKDEAEEHEIMLIKKYKANNPQYGYNIDNGGNSIGKLSESTIKKLSEYRKQFFNTEEGRAIQREKAKKRTPQPLSQKTKDKISVANRKSHEHKIIRYSMDGEILGIYSSASEAERQLGIKKSDICRCAKGERKTCHKSIWRYEKEINK